MVTFQDTDPGAISALEKPWRAETLAQVRTGKVKPTFSTREPSAIYKQRKAGAIKVTHLRCEGDEHAFELHGGPEKALLQYRTAQSEASFIPGAFRENFVATYANERNVCIGDVTGPRQPCYKLNHRFQAGDDMVLLERPNPEWRVARIQFYLYHNMRNEESMREILEVKELSTEMRDISTNRLKKQFENQAGRLQGAPEKALSTWLDYRVVEKTKETPQIYSLVFEALAPSKVTTMVASGCHVRVRLGGKLTRTYSVITGDSNRFQLAIALSEKSRGGSEYVHEKLLPSGAIQIGPITPSFPISDGASHHVFVARGIGITAFIASAQHCQRLGASCHLHYLVRSSDDIALKLLLAEFGSNITIYDKSAGKIFDTRTALKQSTTKPMVSPSNLHFETFETAKSGDPFTAQLADSNISVDGEESQTLLDVLRGAGFNIPSLCEAGNCGTCRVGVKDGRIYHRGTGLPEADKCSSILSCVSRGVGTIVLEL
ncbi:pyruvate kinase-like protein [Aspergillus granulosus]|uniref:Pyruvate kinase-like protein n=1 Tax=Aspergillus granulosus TaxID=176169 RepID=A0ABR4HB89_9EURO